VTFVDELGRRLRDVEIADCLFEEPDAPIYLTGASNVTAVAGAALNPNLGLLIQPGTDSYRLADIRAYGWWAADNGCYSAAEGFDIDAWARWIVDVAAAENVDRCLFAVAPDVLRWHEAADGRMVPVGDALATLERSEPLLPLIAKLGLPAALVAQDGLEELEVPWSSFDVLFIGGSDDWKLGQAAADLAGEARSLGKWIHMGRVNSWKRIAIARLSHCDSFDGTYLRFGPDENWPRLEGWLKRLRRDSEAVTFVENSVVRPPSELDYHFRPMTLEV
jgi:hypothetical protein